MKQNEGEIFLKKERNWEKERERKGYIRTRAAWHRAQTRVCFKGLLESAHTHTRTKHTHIHTVRDWPDCLMDFFFIFLADSAENWAKKR